MIDKNEYKIVDNNGSETLLRYDKPIAELMLNGDFNGNYDILYIGVIDTTYTHGLIRTIVEECFKQGLEVEGDEE